MKRVVQRLLRKLEWKYQIGMALAGGFAFLSICFCYVRSWVLALVFFTFALIQSFNALNYLEIKNEIRNKFTFWR